MTKTITLRQACEETGIPIATLRRLCKSRQIEYLQLGAMRGTVRIVADSLSQFLASKTRGGSKAQARIDRAVLDVDRELLGERENPFA